jgi:hypothetical protein
MKPLDELSHAELYALREQPEAMQGMLAPLEHRAFAREWMEENPWAAGLSLPFMIPGYAIAKALGLQKSRTPASMDQVMGGFHGYAEGMLNNLVPSAQAAKKQPPRPQMPPARYDPDALRRLEEILRETPVLSDSMPPPSWHQQSIPQTIDETVDPIIQRGWIHGMPSGSEQRTPQIEPDDYMDYRADKKKKTRM